MNDATKQSTPEQPESVARRNILRGAMIAAPVIATLHSGAALARSSSLIGKTWPGGALDGSGRTLCLDKRSGTMISSNTMDLGAPPSGSVTRITERDYRTGASWGSSRISEAEMCARGDTFYYRSSGSWRNATVPRGMLVSATALSSFAGSINYRNV
jgi:hypothetical protein